MSEIHLLLLAKQIAKKDTYRSCEKANERFKCRLGRLVDFLTKRDFYFRLSVRVRVKVWIRVRVRVWVRNRIPTLTFTLTPTPAQSLTLIVIFRRKKKKSQNHFAANWRFFASQDLDSTDVFFRDKERKRDYLFFGSLTFMSHCPVLSKNRAPKQPKTVSPLFKYDKIRIFKKKRNLS